GPQTLLGRSPAPARETSPRRFRSKRDDGAPGIRRLAPALTTSRRRSPALDPALGTRSAAHRRAGRRFAWQDFLRNTAVLRVRFAVGGLASREGDGSNRLRERTAGGAPTETQNLQSPANSTFLAPLTSPTISVFGAGDRALRVDLVPNGPLNCDRD